MRPVLFRSAGPVTLLGAGPVPRRRLAEALTLAPTVVAADGGADTALPEGRGLAAVIGDLDSVRSLPELERQGVPVHAIDEQISTDLEKCLRSIAAPLILGLGFLGGRIDHHLAAMSALVKFPGQRVVLIGREDICLLCPPVLELDLAAGTRVSLYPLMPATGTLSEGLLWSVDGLTLRPDGRLGTSNTAEGGPVRIAFDAPSVLVILPQAVLRQVCDALVSSSR